MILDNQGRVILNGQKMPLPDSEAATGGVL